MGCGSEDFGLKMTHLGPASANLLCCTTHLLLW
jgi:hypothetical protein